MTLLILWIALYGAGIEHPAFYIAAASAWFCRCALVYGWPFSAGD